jgi:predicted HicB family RNase H-like nuclease
MQLLTYKNYTGSIDTDLDRDLLQGKILCISDLVTYEAVDLKTLRLEFESAVDDYIQTCREIGKSPEKPFNGIFQVRTKPELHRLVALRAVEDGLKLNAVVVSALEAYVCPETSVVHTHNHDHKITVVSDPVFWESNVSAGQPMREINMQSEEANRVQIH